MTAHGGNHLAEGNLGADPRVERDSIAVWAPRHRRADSNEPLGFGVKKLISLARTRVHRAGGKKMLSAAADQSGRGIGAGQRPFNLA